MQYTLSTAIECIEVNLKSGVISKEQAKELIAKAYAVYSNVHI